MKKEMIISALCVFTMNAHAQSPQPTGGNPIDLTLVNPGIFDPGNDQNPPMKGPVQAPYVTLNDHTLYIWSQHNGYVLTLYDDNDTVVYQTYLFAGVQYSVLPTTLSGSFTLILSDDTYLFTGMIDLE